MQKKLFTMLAVVFSLVIAGSALAAEPFAPRWVVTYDGYVQRNALDTYLADTLIVVNNSHKTIDMLVWIEVFDKHGDPIPAGSLGQTLLNDGEPLESNTIPVNGYGWITLGMIIDRSTHDPWGEIGGAEKFSFRISYAGQMCTPPITEVKQVIYHAGTKFPGKAIWQPANIKTWAETCLGGLMGPGVTKVPNKMKWGLTADKALAGP